MDGGAPTFVRKGQPPIRPPSLIASLQTKGISKPKQQSNKTIIPSRSPYSSEFKEVAKDLGPGINPLDVAAALRDSEAIPAATDIGVSKRDAFFQTLLRVFAKSDFKHDFGEKIPSRDWITNKDRQRFSEMVQKFPVKQRVFMLNEFDKMFPDEKAGSNLLTLLKGTIAEALYPGPTGTEGEFITEDEILMKVGLEYKPLKESIKAHFAAESDSPFAKEIKFNVGKMFTRKYRVGAQRYKNQDATPETTATTRNLASLFKDVTGGKTNFAILVDASLGMSVSKIGDSSLTPDPGVPCNFVVLQNVESDGDSATGSTSFPMTPGGENPTTVDVMRDVTTSTVLYPIWEDPNLPRSDTEILFSKIQILLNRVEAGDVEASIILGDESHNIPDIATTSNVKNASLNGLAALFTSKLLGDAATTGDRRKPYIYALLKRMGDWCQALSLLDRTRQYTRQSGESETLEDLIAKGYEVGLVTNDRILLAYGLVLGLNVYFTTASDLGCLVYFKNIDDTAVQVKLEEKTQNNLDTFTQLFPGVVSEKIQEAIGAYSMPIPLSDLSGVIKANLISQGVADDGILDGIVSAFRTKVILSNLGELRTNFAEIESGITNARAIYENPATPRDKYTASVTLVNLANKFNLDYTHNTFVLDRLMKGTYSGTFTAQQNIFADLATKMATGGNLTLSETMARAKEVLLSCRDDIKQVLQKNIMTYDQLLQYIPSIPGPDGNFEELYGAFDALRAEIPIGIAVGGASRRGGANEVLIKALLQRRVFPYKSAKLETTVRRLEKDGNTAALELLNFLPAAQIGSYYRDDKSRPYSVIDQYLITKEDANVVSMILSRITEDSKEVVDFIVYRFALLYHDSLYERYEHIVDDSNVEGVLSRDLEIEDAEATEGSLQEFAKITDEVLLLRVLVNRYANGIPIEKNDLLSIFHNGVDAALLETYTSTFAAAENALAKADIETNLSNIRSVIFAKYQPQTIETFTTMTEGGQEITNTTSNLESFLDSEGGDSLQGGSDTPPNAEVPSDSSRRRLYAGLRKRTGTGTPPGV